MKNLLLVLGCLAVLSSCGNRCQTPPDEGIVFDINNATSFLQASDNIVVEESLDGFNLLITHPNLSGEFVELRIDTESRLLTFFRLDMFGIRIDNDDIASSEVFSFGTEEFDCYRFVAPNNDFKSGDVDLAVTLLSGETTSMRISWTVAIP